MITVTLFDVLLFKDRSVLGPAQQIPGGKMVAFSAKNKKDVLILREFLEK